MKPDHYTRTHALNERTVADELATAWGCTIHRLPHFHSLDYFAERDGRLIAWVEIKCRAHASTTYPTAWLAWSKWEALRFREAHSDGEARFVWSFTDGVRWIPAAEVDARHPRVLGNGQRTEVEPMILVPITDTIPL